VERVKNGEANALTDEPILMFTMTSGSTGAPKLIPVTETTRNNHRELTRLWYYRAYLDHPSLFSATLCSGLSALRSRVELREASLSAPLLA
jgi:phenylacetate-coenzyme A ligase PaaK-like adenylate-forming protein